jgi:hypothetical protein
VHRGSHSNASLVYIYALLQVLYSHRDVRRPKFTITNVLNLLLLTGCSMFIFTTDVTIFFDSIYKNASLERFMWNYSNHSVDLSGLKFRDCIAPTKDIFMDDSIFIVGRCVIAQGRLGADSEEISKLYSDLTTTNQFISFTCKSLEHLSIRNTTYSEFRDQYNYDPNGTNIIVTLVPK